MLTPRIQYLLTILPFVLAFIVMAIWMFADPISVEKVDETYTYRPKHNVAWLALPLGGMLIASGVFLARRGRLLALCSLVFFSIGVYVLWTALTLDLSNHQVRVTLNEV